MSTMVRKRFVVAHAPTAVVAAERARATGLTRVGATIEPVYGATTPEGQALIAQQHADAFKAQVLIYTVLGAGTLAGAWVGYTWPPSTLFPSLLPPKVVGAIAGGFTGFIVTLIGGFWYAMTHSAEM